MGIIQRSLVLSLISLINLLITNTDATLVESIQDGRITYDLHYNKIPYSWSDANQLCYDHQSALAQPPFSPGVIGKLQTDYSLDGEVWISGNDAQCLSLREDCIELRQSAFGLRCVQHSLETMTTDCQSKKRYVVCSRERDKPLPTTTDSSTPCTPHTTSILDTTTTTTPTTTIRPTSTTRAPATVTLPSSTAGRPYPQPPAITSPPEYPSKPIPSDSSNEDKTNNEQTHASKFAHLLIGISMANKDLLGLIIGVVIGSFLIVTLIFVLCCACQGQKTRRHTKQDYEYMERNSEHSLLKAAQSDSNNSSNTLDQPTTRLTEESSLEMSEAHSHSPHLLPQIPPRNYNYPPPPSIYNGSSDHYSEIPPPKHTDSAGAHNSNIGAGRSPSNVTYASINKNRDSIMSADFPPPPPPQHGYEGLDLDDEDEETCIKGLNSTFKTHLNQTLAVKPQPPVSPVSPVRSYHKSYPPHLSVDGSKLPPPPPPERGATEKPGLITSDL